MPGQDCVLAGWSDEHEAFTCFLMSTHDGHGTTPWEVVRLDGLVTPVTSFPVNLADPAIDPVADGLRILRDQRDGPQPGVGGFAQLTSVYMDRIETRILDRWTD